MTEHVRSYRTVLVVIAVIVIWLVAYQDTVANWVARLGYGGTFALPAGAFIMIYQVILILYDRVLWRYMHRQRYLGGVWAYWLHNFKTDAHVYGVFQINHRPYSLSLPRGRVWYCPERPTQQNLRGIWTSQQVSSDDENVQILFRMESTTEKAEAGGVSLYNGLLLFSKSSPDQMEGRFFDLDQHRGHYGTVRGKRLRHMSFASAPSAAWKLYGSGQDDAA